LIARILFIRRREGALAEGVFVRTRELGARPANGDCDTFAGATERPRQFEKSTSREPRRHPADSR
jgi:hypothetical protein